MTGQVDILSATLLTLELAASATVLLLIIGTPLGWWLARSRSGWVEPVGAAVSLPLVLPPTVLGFYLLVALGPQGPGGAIASLWGARSLAFSFPGLVIGSVIYSLPFVVTPIRGAFEVIRAESLEAAATLGASPVQTFLMVSLPQARRGYLSGAVLGFAHTIGEFGVVLMIGGNIPGETKVLSIAIFDYVERLQWGEAHMVAVGMVAVAFAAVALTGLIDRRGTRRLSG